VCGLCLVSHHTRPSPPLPLLPPSLPRSSTASLERSLSYMSISTQAQASSPKGPAVEDILLNPCATSARVEAIPASAPRQQAIARVKVPASAQAEMAVFCLHKTLRVLAIKWSLLADDEPAIKDEGTHIYIIYIYIYIYIYMYMYMCMCMHTHTCYKIYIHKYMQMHIHVHALYV
jgi:hypothetical protein